jgi:hypothetical protein
MGTMSPLSQKSVTAHRSLQLLGSQFQVGIVLYDGEHVLPFGDQLLAVPLSALWARKPKSAGKRKPVTRRGIPASQRSARWNPMRQLRVANNIVELPIAAIERRVGVLVIRTVSVVRTSSRVRVAYPL